MKRVLFALLMIPSVSFGVTLTRQLSKGDATLEVDYDSVTNQLLTVRCINSSTQNAALVLNQFGVIGSTTVVFSPGTTEIPILQQIKFTDTVKNNFDKWSGYFAWPWPR